METKVVKKLPRGLRNNNPLNIRKGSYWLGLSEKQDDPDFCQFKSLVFGVRAGFRLLRTYIIVKKLNTIRLIISRWAPSNENDTESYIANVVKDTGFPDNYVISFYDREVMIILFNAMARVEIGQKIARNVLINGYGIV